MRRTEEMIRQQVKERGRGRDNRRDGSGRRARADHQEAGGGGSRTKTSFFTAVLKSGLSMGAWFLARRYVGATLTIGFVGWQCVSAIGIKEWYCLGRDEFRDGQEWCEFFQESWDVIHANVSEMYDDLMSLGMVLPLLWIFIYWCFS